MTALVPANQSNHLFESNIQTQTEQNQFSQKIDNENPSSHQRNFLQSTTNHTPERKMMEDFPNHSYANQEESKARNK